MPHNHHDQWGCAHDHQHHEHGAACHCPQCNPGKHGITFTHAAGATAVAASWRQADLTEEKLAEGIASLTEAIRQAGGLIGHIKAALTLPEQIAVFSCTGRDVRINHPACSTAKAELTAIVFGLEEELLKKLLTEEFPQITAEQ